MTFDSERLLPVYPGIDAGQPRSSKAAVSMVWALRVVRSLSTQIQSPFLRMKKGDKASDCSSERKLHRFAPVICISRNHQNRLGLPVGIETRNDCSLSWFAKSSFLRGRAPKRDPNSPIELLVFSVKDVRACCEDRNSLWSGSSRRNLHRSHARRLCR